MKFILGFYARFFSFKRQRIKVSLKNHNNELQRPLLEKFFEKRVIELYRGHLFVSYNGPPLYHRNLVSESVSG